MSDSDFIASFMNEAISKLRETACCAMVDQGRRIGDDPVGYACYEPAKHSLWFGGHYFMLCDKCYEIMGSDPDRITVHLWRAKIGGE